MFLTAFVCAVFKAVVLRPINDNNDIRLRNAFIIEHYFERTKQRLPISETIVDSAEFTTDIEDEQIYIIVIDNQNANANANATPLVINETDHCSICMEPYLSERKEIIKLTKCGHMFHSKCLERWVATKEICPLCRDNCVVKET